MKPPVDPKIADFIKALARANAARDIARFKGTTDNGEPERKNMARTG
jgi:hypothetical protein